jgi:hypothetical protein
LIRQLGSRDAITLDIECKGGDGLPIHVADVSAGSLIFAQAVFLQCEPIGGQQFGQLPVDLGFASAHVTDQYGVIVDGCHQMTS